MTTTLTGKPAAIAYFQKRSKPQFSRYTTRKLISLGSADRYQPDTASTMKHWRRYATQTIFSPQSEPRYTRPSLQRGQFAFTGEFRCSNTLQDKQDKQGKRRSSCATASQARW
jgi:hypothetical protein